MATITTASSLAEEVGDTVKIVVKQKRDYARMQQVCNTSF